MTTLTIRFDGELGSLSADSFMLVMNESLHVLNDLDHVIAQQRKRTIKWIIVGLKEQSPTIVLESRLLKPSQRRSNRHVQSVPEVKDYSANIRDNFTRGVALLETGEGTPPYYSTENVKSVGRIVEGFQRNGIHGVSYEAGGNQATLTPSAGPRIARLTGEAYHTYGAIEGYVQMVSVRPRNRRFSITHARTLKSVRCNFLADVEDSVFDALKSQRRVIVSGRISYNAEHEPLAIMLGGQPIRFLREESELPTIEQLAGSDLEVTGGLSTEEFVRSLRDG